MADQLLTGTTQIEKTFAFNSSDFDLDSSNILNLKNKTSYWSCPGNNFIRKNVSNVSYDYTSDGEVEYEGGTPNYVAPVFLPEGAVITGAIIYASSAFSSEWELKRVNISTSTSTVLASAAQGVEDTSITNATIDNSTYAYFFHILDVGGTGIQQLHGARITYTTDYV